MYNSLRSITVISKTHIELLVISKEVYILAIFFNLAVLQETLGIETQIRL